MTAILSASVMHGESGREIECRVEDRIATITLRRPPINALTAPNVAALRRMFQAIETDPRIGAVIVTGGVRNAFCSGGDLNSLFGDEMRSYSSNERKRLAEDMQAAFTVIAEHPKPVIAAINGVAFGAGLELALVCDIRIASELAYFSLPELGHQIIPALGGTVRLAQIIGLGRAKEMLMTGRRVRAEEAMAWGLVHVLTSRTETLERAHEYARRLADYPGDAFSAMKRAIHRGVASPPDSAQREETREFVSLLDRRLENATREGRMPR